MTLVDYLRSLRVRVRGRDFWRSVNRILGIGIYTTIVVGIMLFPAYIFYMFFVYAIFIPCYGWIFTHHLRNMEKQDKGNKLIEGWVTHAYGIGERVYFTPIKFELVDRLSPDDLKDVQTYINTLKQYAEIIELDTGLERFKPKQITFEENIEKEIKDKEDMKKIVVEENEELGKYQGEYKKIMALEQKNNNKKIKKEIKDRDELKDGK